MGSLTVPGISLDIFNQILLLTERFEYERATFYPSQEAQMR